jgi:putative addiction module killer protein
MYEIFHYQTADGRDPFQEWLNKLRDRQAKARIAVRINRMAAGNFGDHKPVGGGVWELRIDAGPGYRVYYALAGAQVVLLLVGGDKSSQQTDIERATAYWADQQRRGADDETTR